MGEQGSRKRKTSQAACRNASRRIGHHCYLRLAGSSEMRIRWFYWQVARPHLHSTLSAVIFGKCRFESRHCCRLTDPCRILLLHGCRNWWKMWKVCERFQKQRMCQKRWMASPCDFSLAKPQVLDCWETDLHVCELLLQDAAHCGSNVSHTQRTYIRHVYGDRGNGAA